MCFYPPPVRTTKAKCSSKKPHVETRIISCPGPNSQNPTSAIPPYVTISKTKIGSKPPITIETGHYVPPTTEPTPQPAPTWSSATQWTYEPDAQRDHLRMKEKQRRRSSIFDQIAFIQDLSAKLNPKPAGKTLDEKKEENEKGIEAALKIRDEKLDKLSNAFAGFVREGEMKEAVGKARGEGVQEGLKKAEGILKEEREKERERDREQERRRLTLLGAAGGLGIGNVDGVNGSGGGTGNVLGGFGFGGMMGGSGLDINGLNGNGGRDVHYHLHNHQHYNSRTDPFAVNLDPAGTVGYANSQGFSRGALGNSGIGALASPPVMRRMEWEVEDLKERVFEVEIDRCREREERQREKEMERVRRSRPPPYSPSYPPYPPPYPPYLPGFSGVYSTS